MSSLRNQGTINLVVAHREDAAAQLAVARVADLVKSGAVDPLLHVWTDSHTPLPQAKVIGGNENIANVTEVLAEVRKLDRVRIVGLFCPSAGVDHASELDHSVRAIVDVINETKGAATEVAEIRVQATSADAPQVARAAFSGLALANIVLIPHDRRSDVAAARFVESAQTDRIAAHIAVELCSMLGAWSSMKGSFLDDWAYTPPSGDGPSIVFLRSVVRSLICPPLPVDRIVEEGSVPMPQGFLPSPNPEATVRAVADAVFPDELRFHANPAPARREEIPLGEALRKVPKAIWKTMRSLPRVFRDGLSRDLESLQGDGLQDLVGGEASWLHIDYRDRQTASDARSWSEQARDAIDDLETRDEMPALVGLPDDVWERLVELPLAVADGSKTAEAAMSETGERRYLVADPMAFAGGNYVDNEAAISGLLAAVDPPTSRDAEVDQGDMVSESASGEDLSAEESPVSANTSVSDDASEPDQTESDAVATALSEDAPEQAEGEDDA